MPKPPKPLPPVFHNQRARLAEHEGLMHDARVRHGTHAICPDCYEPAPRCLHRKENR